ncbi:MULTISPECIES: phage tail tape measure protein [unclassified Paenibacillus]|uniref:phage tail tape measure protein n=1 Tax=unclassified Paenibacillus TaxID=185978 RepID=UPI00089AD475|nr:MULTISPECIES: phage tail tape measure protein [unclassified Paenibacillus]SDW56187.1 Phage-related minor tail protein [Paenibacillus sp. PDC88]
MAETQGQKHSLTTEILMDFGQSVTKTGEFAGEVSKLGTSFNTLSDAVHKVANDTERMNLAIGDKIAKAVGEIKDGSNLKLNAKNIQSAVESAIASKLTSGKVTIEGDLAPLSINLTQKKWSSMTSEVRTKIKEAIDQSSIKVGNVKPFVFSEYGFRELQNRFNTELQAAITNRMSFAWGTATKEMKDGTLAKVPKPMKFEVGEEHLKTLMTSVSTEFMKHISDPKNITIGNIQPVQIDSARLNMAVSRIKEAIGDIDKHLLNVNLDELKKLPNLDKGMMNFRAAMETTVAQITQLDAELKGLKLNGTSKELTAVMGKIQELRTTVVDKVGSLITSVGEEIKTIPVGTKEYANYKATLDNVGHIVNNHIQAEINGIVTGLAARLGIDPSSGASTKGSAETNKWVASIKGVQELLIASAESAVKNLSQANLGIDFNLIIAHFNEWSKQMRAKMLVDSQESLDKMTAQLTASNKDVLNSFARAITNVTSFRYDSSKLGEVRVDLPVDQLRPRVLAEIENVIKEMVQGFKAVPHGEAGTVGSVTLPEGTTTAINTALKAILSTQSEHLLAQLRQGAGAKPSAEDTAQLDAVMAQESKELIKLIVNQAAQNARSLAEGINAKGFASFTKDDQARIKQEMESTLQKTVTEFSKAVDNAFGAFAMTAATTEAMHGKLSTELNRMIAQSNVTFLDAKEPLVLTGAVTHVQKKLEEAVMANIAAWKPEATPLNVAADAPMAHMRKAMQSMMHMASNKVVEGVGGIADGANAIFMNPKQLHKDVRRALATAEGFDRVSDWEKAFKAGVSLEKATGQVMTEGVRQVMNMFHNSVAKNTTSAISAYGEALGRVDIQPDLTSVHVMVRRVGEMMDTVQFRMVEALTKNLDAFYKGAIDGIKNLPPVTQSIGYRPPAGAAVNAAAPRPFPFGEANNPLVGNPRSTALVDPRYPTADKLPKGYNEFDMMNRWEREAQIKVLNTKNRFENSDLTNEQKGQLHNFLDKEYLARVQEAVSRFQQGHRVGDQSPYQTLRDAILDASLSLRYTVEQFRKMNMGSTTQANATEMKGKLREYGYDTQLNVESMKTKFLNKLNPEQFTMLENYLNEVQAKVNRLASSDIINEKDITNARMEMRELNRELDVISKGFDRMAKVSGMEGQIDKLSEKMNRLLMNSQLPINKIAHLGDLINGSYSDPTKFSQAKDYYADLVRDNRALQAEQRRAEAKAESEAKREMVRQQSLANSKMAMEERLRVFEDNQRVGADRLLGKYRNKLSNEDYATLQSQVSNHLGRVGDLVRSPITDFSSLSVIKEDMATILNRVKEIATSWDNVLKDNRVSREMDVLNAKLEKIRQIGKVDQAEIQAVQNAINAVATDATRMNPAKDALNRVLELQAQRIAEEKVANRLAGVDLNRRMYDANQTVAMDKMKDKYLRKLSSDDYAKLVSDLDAHKARIGSVTAAPINNDTDAANVQAMMKTLNIQLAEIARRYNALAADESFQTKLIKLRRDLEALKLDNLVDVSSIAKLGEMIDKAITDGDIVQARLYRDELMKTNRELKALQAQKQKRGEKIGESNILKGDKAVFTEQLNAVLKTVDALKGYEITQLNVNNATNTWTAKMRDAEGNLRTLTGSIDKATGELFKHSEALQMVTQNALRASSSIGSNLGRSGDILGNYMSNPVQDKRNQQANSAFGGFGTSVLNTMRYITAGAVMGYPTMLLNESFQSAKEMDYQLAKANQNFQIKYLEQTGGTYTTSVDGEEVTAPELLPNMSRLGEVLVEGAMDMLEQKYGGTLTEQQKATEVETATAQVNEYMKTGAVKDLQMIALLNGIDQEEVGLAYHIASRRYDNPYEATAFAKEVAKVRSIEEVDVEKTATGFEAISSQWGISGYALNKVTNMMIMAANISQAKIEDLIATQQKAGSMFRNAMGDQDKETALAHSIAYSSMFVQATARSGAESGTFWKAILDKPYTKKGRDELAAMAATNPEVYGNLNPYNEDGSQKDFSDIFASILETSATMNDESRIQMWQKLFPQWHMGSAAAVSAFTADLQHTMEKVMHVTGDAEGSDKDGDGNLSVKESIDAYVAQIQGADENTAMYIRAGMMDTWKFRQSQIKTSWQVATYEAWEELKGEFSNLATYLTAFLRIVGDNAGGIADTMGLIARIMAGVGVRIAWGKLNEAIDNADKKKQASKIESYGMALNENARMENLRRIGIQEEMAQHQSRAEARNSRRAEVNTKIVEKEGEVLGLQAKRDQHQELYQKAVADGDTTAASFHAAERDQADNTAKAKSKEVEQLRKELGSLDEQDAKTKRSLEALSTELGENGQAMTQLQNRAKALTLAMDDMGMDSTELKNNLNFLNREFQSGAVDASRYDAEINKIGKEAGMSDDDISKLKREVDKLNDSFREGTLDATKYVNKMKELERAHLTGALGVNEMGVGAAGAASQTGMGLAEYAMMGLLAKDLLPNGGGGKRGVFTKIKDVFQTKSLGSLFNKKAPARDNNGDILRDPDGNVIRQSEIDMARDSIPARDANGRPLTDRDGNPLTEGDVRRGRAAAGAADNVADAAKGGNGILGKISGVGNTLSKGLKLARPLKAIPYIGAALAGADLLMAAIDPLTAMGMTDSEKKGIQAENKEGLANNFRDWEESSGLGAWWKGANLVWDGAFSGVSNLLGGNAPSWGDYWEGFQAVRDGDGKYVEETLASKYNYEQEATEAKVEAQMELNKKLEEQNKYHPLDTNKDGLLDPATDGANQTLDYESLDTLMAKISGEMNKGMTHNESTYQINRSRLLISGVREDSKQMRDLMEQYLRENLKFFDEAIKKLQETYDLMADGDEKDKVGAELDNLKSQKAQTELEIDGVKNSAIDELERKMTDQLDLTQMDYDKRMYDLLAANGGKDDAPEVKALEKARVADVNAQLEGFKTEWDTLLKTGGFNPNSDEYMTIFKQLQSIGVEQSKNLAEINKNTSQSQSTFNLPSGLKVMDYFDYMTKNNTHKSVMVGAGNVTVHVNIDNMTGDTKDVEKMTSALEKTLKKNNSGLVNQFANDVKANMGSNYKGL